MQYIKKYLPNGYFVFDRYNKVLTSWSLPFLEPAYSEHLKMIEDAIGYKVGLLPNSSFRPIRVNKRRH